MTAYEQGFRNGRLDKLLGYTSTYATFVEPWPGYTRSYAIGYRHGQATP